MRNPDVVLDNLSKKAESKDYVFDRLYRNLYNQSFYLAAYHKIYAKEGNMTKGTDNQTIDGMSSERFKKIISCIRDESYQPKPAKRKYIQKKNGGKRPLGIPSVDDKLVQEIVRRLLEAIYEPKLSDNSHGFRPNKSCHTALQMCKSRFNGVRWFVEGDIKSFFDNINHKILIKILRKTIKDEKFIRLIWKFLKAGYVEDWAFHNTYSGTPQGGIISPILSNIYLDELDQYMEEYKEKFDKGIKRKGTKEYSKYQKRAKRYKNKHIDIWENLTDDEKKPIIQKYKVLQKDIYTVPYLEPMDDGFKRLQYVRYADDFIIGVIGSKKDAEFIKKSLTIFLSEKLGLELSQEKTLITHSRKMAKFLGYEITVSRSQQRRKDVSGRVARTNSYKCHLYMPQNAWVGKLKELDAINITKEGKWKPKHRTYLINHDDLEIISIYNAEIRGLYQYFKLANNVSALAQFRYFMKYSMLKTFGGKYQKSVAKMYQKFKIGKELGIKYNTKDRQKVRYFHNEGFHKIKDIKDLKTVNDQQPPKAYFNARSGLLQSLTASKCNLCGAENTPIEMHHVRKLKDLKGKKTWEKLMIARKRKTIPLCHKCHVDLHAGRLD